MAPNDGTYYVQITGDPGAKFDLVVTRGADFTTQPHNTPATAQDITATQQSGNSKQGGALGSLQNPSGAFLGTTIEGIDFNGSNCGCLPPDTNAAVGNGFVAETVNVQFRVWDTSGNQLLDEPLSTLFGQATAGDPFVLYDAVAGHWYVTGIDGADNSKELLAISNDANPLDGFSNVYAVPVAASGDLTDFAKPGYNYDAIVIEANDFGDGHSVVTTVDKAQAIAGNLVYYQSTPSFNFRALVPAQMTDSTTPGGPMWFMASTGDPNSDGTTPNTIRVTEMTNVLSNSPVYTDYTVPIGITYGATTLADQPGAPGSVTTNDVTATSVDYLNGMMVTAFPATTAADGFKYTKSVWVEVNVSGGTPVLVQAGVVNPGPGVSAFFPGAAIDPAGNIGISYMESSSTEYVSAAVAGHIAGSPLGSTTAGTVFAPGGGSMPYSFREGDYGTAVYDPGTGLFWGANEYIGSDGSTNIWRTKIASFSVFSAIGTDYYAVNANAGDNLHFATSTPAGGPQRVRQQLLPRAAALRPERQSRRRRRRQRLRRAELGHRFHGARRRRRQVDHRGHRVAEHAVADLGRVWPAGHRGDGRPRFLRRDEHQPARRCARPAAIDHHRHLQRPGPRDIADPGRAGSQRRPGHRRHRRQRAIRSTWTVDPSSYATGDRPAERRDDRRRRFRRPGHGRERPDPHRLTATRSSRPTWRPIVVSSSIDGQVFSPAPANVTEVVTFSQPMNTSFTTSSSFELMGNYRNVQYAAASFSWDPTGTILTINYANLPDDTYTLTLFASGFENLVGIPLASNYVANFAVTLGTAAFPTPFTPVPPLGDLIYTGSDTHVLATPTDVDYLTVSLNAGETLTLIGTPTTSSLQLVFTVLDPNDNVIATSSAPAAGRERLPRDRPDHDDGHLHDRDQRCERQHRAVLDPGLPQQLRQAGHRERVDPDRRGPHRQLLPAGPRQCRSARGRGQPADRRPQRGRCLRLVPILRVLQLGIDDPGHPADQCRRPGRPGDPGERRPVPVALRGRAGSGQQHAVCGRDHQLQRTARSTASCSSSTRITGQQVATITLPTDNANNFYYYPYGFSIASDGSFWIPQPNSGNIIHLDASYNEIGSYSAGGLMPESASIGTDGNVYFSTDHRQCLPAQSHQRCRQLLRLHRRRHSAP